MGHFEMASEHFGVALASLWGDFGVMLWSLCAFGAALGSHLCTFGFLCDPFGGYSVCFWVHRGHMSVASGHFGVVLGLL